MKVILTIAIIFSLLLKTVKPFGVDGLGCTICNFIVFELDRYEEIEIGRIEKFLEEDLCSAFSHFPTFEKGCELTVKAIAKDILDYLESGSDPFKLCHEVGLCNKCYLYIDNGADSLDGMRKEEKRNQALAILKIGFLNILKQLGKLWEYPLMDHDDDGFTGLKDATFRGRDCADHDKNIHPLIKGEGNCNGIYGKDENGVSYEEKFCGSFGDNDKNFLVFGDSVSTGFSIYAEFFDFVNFGEFIRRTTTSQFSYPEKAVTSGYHNPNKNSSQINLENGSFYKNVLRRNKCAHRQYANFGVIGAQMKDLVGQVKKLKIERSKMKPSFVYLGYIGNDVCTHVDAMTKPEDYKKQLLAGLKLLDQKLQKNSKVILIGLSNGAQYEIMKNATHPLSSSFRRVTYSSFYDFLNCVDMNPCPTWLSSDPKARAAGTKRAKELDEQMKFVSENYNWKNFETHFVDIDEVIGRGLVMAKKDGFKDHEFYNQFDGFHPSVEVGHPYCGKAFHELHGEIFGPTNPFNEEIMQIFGSQGGW